MFYVTDERGILVVCEIRTGNHKGVAMPFKGKRDAGELEFTRAAADEMRDAESAYHVLFEYHLGPDEQRGIYRLEVFAYDADREIRGLPVVSCAAYWPNSHAVSFGAFLFQQQHKVCRMVEEWHRSGRVGHLSR